MPPGPSALVTLYGQVLEDDNCFGRLPPEAAGCEGESSLPFERSGTAKTSPKIHFLE